MPDRDTTFLLDRNRDVQNWMMDELSWMMDELRWMMDEPDPEPEGQRLLLGQQVSHLVHLCV